ncbi:hypothetical protein R3P38DRAFT_3331406 [Favolaschia claudopus]|uniref:Uncharacterized protein n=1 Tax=Favolaschia claudopus TaxID=2862362 RepID=A0AAV9ZTS8_9AGAR
MKPLVLSSPLWTAKNINEVSRPLSFPPSSLRSASPPYPIAKRGVDPALVPDFGVNPGTNPTGTGDCDGINGIKIPCSCPPSRQDFLNSLSANVAAGHDVNNPGGAAIARMQTIISSLQNLRGPGRPRHLPLPPPPAAPAPGGVDPNLVPQFGIQQGTNPTGTGDCDGVNGIKIPCSCPPNRDDFIRSLSADVAAGHDINNPGVPAPFPTDNSKQSQIVRLQTSITTLQNLRGPGVGCPAAATTFLAQIKALQG